MYANTLHVLPTAEGDGSFVESSRICTCFASYILRGIKHETNPHNYSYVHTCTRIHSQLNTRMQITHTHIYYILWKREMFVANMHIFTILPQGSCNHKWQFNKDTHTLIHIHIDTNSHSLNKKWWKINQEHELSSFGVYKLLVCNNPDFHNSGSREFHTWMYENQPPNLV